MEAIPCKKRKLKHDHTPPLFDSSRPQQHDWRIHPPSTHKHLTAVHLSACKCCRALGSFPIQDPCAPRLWILADLLGLDVVRSLAMQGPHLPLAKKTETHGHHSRSPPKGRDQSAAVVSGLIWERQKKHPRHLVALTVLLKGNKPPEDGTHTGRRPFGRVISNKNGFCGTARITLSTSDEYLLHISNFPRREHYTVTSWWTFGWLGVSLDGMHRMLHNMRTRECMRLNVLHLAPASTRASQLHLRSESIVTGQLALGVGGRQVCCRLTPLPSRQECLLLRRSQHRQALDRTGS